MAFDSSVAMTWMVAGVLIVCVIGAVLAACRDDRCWSAVTGSIIWGTFLGSFTLRRHAQARGLKGQAWALRATFASAQA